MTQTHMNNGSPFPGEVVRSDDDEMSGLDSLLAATRRAQEQEPMKPRPPSSPPPGTHGAGTQQQRPPQTAPRPQTAQRADGRPKSRKVGARQSIKNGMSNAQDFLLELTYEIFVSRKRVLLGPVALVVLVGVPVGLTAFFAPGFFNAWIAPALVPVAFALFVLTLMIWFQPLSQEWGSRWKSRYAWLLKARRFMIGRILRTLLVVLVSVVVGAQVFAPSSAVSLAQGSFGAVSLLGGPVAPVHLQPERGMVTDESFVVNEDGQYSCGVGQTAVLASDEGMFNGVQFTVVTDERGMTIKFADKPVGLSGFVAEGRVAPLDGMNSDNGSHTFVFRQGPYTEVPTTAAMCWAK